ncbi:unnamed protein product [Ectocarpus sp. 13 AM-2016]
MQKSSLLWISTAKKLLPSIDNHSLPPWKRRSGTFKVAGVVALSSDRYVIDRLCDNQKPIPNTIHLSATLATARATSSSAKSCKVSEFPFENGKSSPKSKGKGNKRKVATLRPSAHDDANADADDDMTAEHAVTIDGSDDSEDDDYHPKHGYHPKQQEDEVGDEDAIEDHAEDGREEVDSLQEQEEEKDIDEEEEKGDPEEEQEEGDEDGEECRINTTSRMALTNAS